MLPFYKDSKLKNDNKLFHIRFLDKYQRHDTSTINKSLYHFYLPNFSHINLITKSRNKHPSENDASF